MRNSETVWNPWKKYIRIFKALSLNSKCCIRDQRDGALGVNTASSTSTKAVHALQTPFNTNDCCVTRTRQCLEVLLAAHIQAAIGLTKILQWPSLCPSSQLYSTPWYCMWYRSYWTAESLCGRWDDWCVPRSDVLALSCCSGYSCRCRLLWNTNCRCRTRLFGWHTDVKCCTVVETISSRDCRLRNVSDCCKINQ